MIRDISEIQALATKYSKPQLARMAQMGLIDPTKAVMAGMMIDRITKSNMQPPQTTVAQEALAPVQPPMAPQMGQQTPMSQPPVAPAGIGTLPAQPQPNAGVAALPSGITEMAGGGIVAFDEGGEVPGYAGEEGSVVRAKPGYGRSFEFLPLYVPKTAPPPLASDAGEALYNVGRSVLDPISDFFSAPSSRSSPMRIDPNTGKPVTFGEYMRLQEAERNAAALPEANKIIANVAANRPPLADQPAPAPVKESRAADRGQGRTVTTRANVNRQGPAVTENIQQQLPPAVTEPAVVQEQPLGIASIVPKRPEALNIDPNLGKFTVAPLPVPKERSVKDFLQEQRDAEKEAGVNTDIYKDLMKDLEGKKGKLGERKKEAIGNAIMQTGLALLGSRRGQEFAVLGEAGQKSLQGLVFANEKIRDTEEKIDEARRSLLMSENEYKRTLSTKALESMQKDRDKIEALKIRNIENQNTANLEAEKLRVQVVDKQVSLRGQEMQGYGYESQRASAQETEASRRAGALEVAEKQARSHLEGIEKQGKNQLEVTKLQGANQLAVQRLQNIGMNRPGETERLMSTYFQIEKNQGKEAAEKWLQVQERLSGRGKTSSTNLQEQYADDWNKMDVMQRKNMKDQGITNEQQYIDYRLKLAGRQPTSSPGSNAPAVGTIQEWDGKKWRFKGGTNTKDNWEQVK